MLDIYIDADACPVKEDAFRVAKRYQLKVLVVSRVPMVVPRADWIVPVVAGDGFDSVDDWIDSHIGKDDIVITNDILLAARCLKREARALDPRGRIFDENNIGEKLANRELLSELRQRGEIGLGPAKMEPKNKSNFLSSFDLLINRVKKDNR